MLNRTPNKICWESYIGWGMVWISVYEWEASRTLQAIL